nr:immunoglobulin heavy chain junction region [Mus musculus]
CARSGNYYFDYW